jgi:hypothetical protein
MKSRKNTAVCEIYFTMTEDSMWIFQQLHSHFKYKSLNPLILWHLIFHAKDESEILYNNTQNQYWFQKNLLGA